MKTHIKSRFDGKPPREAPPPSRWGRNKSGSARFVVRKVGFRDIKGRKLYRLGFLTSQGRPPLFSQELWTLERLQAAGVIWLDRSPFDAGVDDKPTDRVEVPEGAVMDDDDDDQDEAPPGPATPAAEPAVPDTFEARYGFGVGDTRLHVDSGKPYRVLGIIDPDTVRVEEVVADGVKRPSRAMRGAKLLVKP